MRENPHKKRDIAGANLICGDFIVVVDLPVNLIRITSLHKVGLIATRESRVHWRSWCLDPKWQLLLQGERKYASKRVDV